jgi:hypothetical protein
MTDDIKETSKRINVRIPADLYSRVVQSYGITEAVVQGLELLMNKPEANIPESPDSPNDGRLVGLQVEVQELRDHNDTLRKELEKAERDKEDLKSVYANYFAQVQTLINQKAIEAPGAKKPWWKIW